jgi:predicted ATPase
MAVLMITSIKLCINHSTKVRKIGISNAYVHFKPGYNVLIGRNGSGKSSVLRAIALCPMCVVAGADRDAIKYITTETLNPNVGGTFYSREEMIQGIRAMFSSHGQGVVDSLRNQMHVNETVVLIDSPETGQDMENSVQIYRGLLKMAKKYQVIVATNSLVFMREGNLIDLGHQSLSRLVKATRTLAAGFNSF